MRCDAPARKASWNCTRNPVGLPARGCENASGRELRPTAIFCSAPVRLCYFRRNPRLGALILQIFRITAPLCRDLQARLLVWCPGAELNHRHLHFQCSALPTELPGQHRPRIGGTRGAPYRVSPSGCPDKQIAPIRATNPPPRAFHPRPRPRSPGRHRRPRASGGDRCRRSACCRTAHTSARPPCGRSDTAGRSRDCSRSWRAYGEIATGDQTALSQPKRMG
jgi:hypothetical protein